jgi:hypothetical protein
MEPPGKIVSMVGSLFVNIVSASLGHINSTLCHDPSFPFQHEIISTIIKISASVHYSDIEHSNIQRPGAPVCATHFILCSPATQASTPAFKANFTWKTSMLRRISSPSGRPCMVSPISLALHMHCSIRFQGCHSH